MWRSIPCSSSNLLLVLAALAAMVACLSMVPHPAASASAAAAAPASANLIHHEGGGSGGERNQANALVAAVNADRTAARLPPLRNSKGLGCMALQYISHCAAAATSPGACDDDAGARALAACHPPETDITEVFAANCGVELPTMDLITARLLGCGTHDDDLPLLGANANTTAVRGKEHTQVGAGLLRPRRHGPYFWCLLFSSGSPASTFRLEAAGKGIAQAHGCFSDPDDAISCSSAGRLSTSMAAALLLLPLFLLS
uniref:Uncharacterized protein n=1 Tax=Avena sativa TaxID=4498 RepID=A0ACD5Y0P5_AVESA